MLDSRPPVVRLGLAAKPEVVPFVQTILKQKKISTFCSNSDILEDFYAIIRIFLKIFLGVRDHIFKDKNFFWIILMEVIRLA